MPELKLTEKRIRGLKPPTDKAYERYWDTEVKGLCVKVRSTGLKTYEFKDRLNGKPIWGKNLPRCSETTLETMRDDSLQWKAQIRRGESPWKVVGMPEVPTVFELCLENITAKKELGRSARHLADMEKAAKCVGSSFLGDMAIGDVAMMEASRFLAQYHGREREHDLLRWFLSNCFELGIKKGYTPLHSNPWHYIDKRYKLPEANDLPRYNDGEIATLAHYLRKAEKGEMKRNYSLVWIKFMWFLVRNGTRPDETRRIRRSWIKPIDGGWIVVHPSTKTGKKIIYLPAASVRDISETPQRESDWLFPGRVSGHLYSYAKPYGAFCKEAGLSKPPYAIRRWYARTGRSVFKGNIKPIQELCGWESEEMALRYAGDDDALLEKAIMANAEVCRQVASRVSEVVGD